MPSYDPQRSRPRPRAAEDEGPAPVDEILGPTTSPDVPTETPSRNGSSSADAEMGTSEGADGGTDESEATSVSAETSEAPPAEVQATIPASVEAGSRTDAAGPPRSRLPRAAAVAVFTALVLLVLIWRRRRRRTAPEPE